MTPPAGSCWYRRCGGTCADWRRRYPEFYADDETVSSVPPTSEVLRALILSGQQKVDHDLLPVVRNQCNDATPDPQKLASAGFFPYCLSREYEAYCQSR